MNLYTYLIAPWIKTSIERMGFRKEPQFNWTVRNVERIHFLEDGRPDVVAKNIEDFVMATCNIGGTPILVMGRDLPSNWLTVIQSLRPYLRNSSLVASYREEDLGNFISDLSKPDQSIQSTWSRLQDVRIQGLYHNRFDIKFLFSYSHALTSFTKAHDFSVRKQRRVFDDDEFLVFRKEGVRVLRYALKALPVCGFDMENYQTTPFGLFTTHDSVRLGKKISCLGGNDEMFWGDWQSVFI